MGGVPQTQSFYRLFMAPGMQHCGGGAGPNAFGGPFGLPAPTHDAAHDVVAALAHWVEDGVAPAQIVATKYQDNDPRKGISMQRGHGVRIRRLPVTRVRAAGPAELQASCVPRRTPGDWERPDPERPAARSRYQQVASD